MSTERMIAVDIMIRKVDRGTPLADKLLAYVNDFSWDEVKEHISRVISGWEFDGWETMFAAADGDKIVGMCSVMKTDYYPLPDIYPWISCIFVSEEYRGRRISGMLIDRANEYAKKLGFERTYIPSVHTGLYEKYGYTYLRDIVNYGGDTDRLYAKELL